MKPYRNEFYLKWVRSLPCVMCGSPADDAHHVVGLHLNITGMGTKPGDEWVMPVTRGCHNAIHGDPSLQQLQPEWLEYTWRMALWHFGPESEIGQQIREARRHLRAQMGEVAA